MVYLISRVFCRFVLFVIRRMEIHGKDNMPDEGGVVIASNHTSMWDPVIIGSAFDRWVSFMAKEELYKINPLFSWLIRHMQTFPVKRGQMDRGALKFALNHLKTGHIIGLFPEGTRSKSGDLQDARNGAAMLAIKAGVPVLPVGIIGSKGWGKVVVKVGKPINIDKFFEDKVNKELLNEFSKSFMAEIEKLLQTTNEPL